MATAPPPAPRFKFRPPPVAGAKPSGRLWRFVPLFEVLSPDLIFR